MAQLMMSSQVLKQYHRLPSEVTNLHALAWTICSRCHWKGRIADDDDMAQVWDEVWQDPSLGELPMSKDELQAEYDLVIDPNGIHSLFKGPAPSVITCADARAEAAAIVAWVQERMENQRLATHEICVTPYKASIRTALEAAGIPTFELKPREMDPGEEEPGIRLGTMHRIKGLEFRAVVLACGDADDPMHHIHEAERRERCTRYVAATRAREYLLVMVPGTVG
jgi:hypothetical protein